MNTFLNIVFDVEEIINLILCSALIFNMKMTNITWRYIVALGAAVAVDIADFYFRLNIGEPDKDILYVLLIILLISQEKILKSVIIEINTIAVVSILGLIPFYAILLSLNTYRKEIGIGYSVIASFILMLFFIVYMIYYRIIRKKEKSLQLSTKQYLILALGLWSAMLMTGFAQMFESMKVLGVRMINAIVLLTDLFGVAFLIVTLWMVKSTMKNVSYKYEKDIMINQMKTQEQYVDMIVRQNDIVRKFRHDVRGHMIILQKHIEDKEYDLAEDYIKGITNLVTNIATDIYTGVAVVDAVIADICSEMENKNITLNWKGRIKGCEEKVTEYELCIIFMNIMKNAIEACENVEKNRNINVNVEYIDGEIHISENNPILGQLKIDEEGILQSQKDDKENHGIGSRNVREIVEKYNGEIEYQVENGRFNVVIVI